LNSSSFYNYGAEYGNFQYAAAQQFVIEGSIQLPVICNTRPQALRTDYNILLGVRYPF
jgi:hypothetical protein